MSSAPKLSRAKRSAIWAYFHEEGSSSVKCKLCAAKLARQSGTTNLFNHLKAHHKVQYLEAVGGPVEVAAAGDSGDKKTSAGTKPLMSFFAPGQVRTCDKTRVGVITEMIVDWIVASVRPLSTVADTGLIELVKFLEPGYTTPSRTHIAHLVDKRHKLCSGQMKSHLHCEGSAGVAMTSDGWSSSATQSYVTHTVHFVNFRWELVSGVLKTGLFSGSHTAANLANFSEEVAADFGLKQGQVVDMCHDEAANMVAAGRLLCNNCDWVSQPCMAHRLPTVIRHALDVREVSALLARRRRLVAHFKQSCLASEALMEKQKQLSPTKQPLKVIQDVSTR